MSAGIIKGVDRGVVGYTEEFGKTWHLFEEYEMVAGEVPFGKAMSTLDYKVHKVPLAFHVPEDMKTMLPVDTHGKVAMTLADPDKADKSSPLYALVRGDLGLNVYNGAVQEGYTVYQNAEFLDEIEKNLLVDYPSIGIESAGSLFGGRIAFINMVIDKSTIPGDISQNVTRLMFTNAFGGKAVAAYVHQTRVVCMNTLRMSEAQGIANDTIKRFRHTSGVTSKVANHLIDLTKLQAVIAAHNKNMEALVVPMNSKEVDGFANVMFPPNPNFTEKGNTRLTNRRETLLNIFDTAEDLQGAIKHTRYAMFNAVTNFSQYHMNENTDVAASWYNVVTGGNRHMFNEKAYDVLRNPVIPETVSVN